MMVAPRQHPRIGVVGPCKSGKSTLVRGLQHAGYDARQISQEHSFAPRMWQQINPPEILIYLHCDYETSLARGIHWTQSEYDEQQPRLAHARENANFSLVTDPLSQDEVLQKVLEYLGSEKD